MRYIALFASIMLLGIAVIGIAEGTNEGAFARDGIGARAWALGGAFVSIADDTSTAYWNPAGIAHLEGYHLGGMYFVGGRLGVSDIKYQNISLLMNPWETGALSASGLGITWINHIVPDIPYTDGENGADFFNDDQSLFLLSLASGFDIDERWNISIGMNLKYYRHTLHTGVGSGFGADVSALLSGVIQDIPISLGLLSMDTLETVVSWTGTTHNPDNYVPWIIKGGISAILGDGVIRLTTDVDFSPSPIHREFPRYSDLDRLHVGLELIPITEFSLRAGAILWRDGSNRLSAGIGIGPLGGLSFDYAFVIEPETELSSQEEGGAEMHILSAEFSFGTSSDDND